MSRPLVYRTWSNRFDVVLDALLGATTIAAPYPDTGRIREDLLQQMQQYADAVAGPLGSAYRAVFAEAQGNPDAATALRERLMGPRRALTRQVLQRATEAGQIESGLDLDVVVDQLYAPVLYRLLLGHAPVDRDLVSDLVAHTLDGITGTSTKRARRPAAPESVEKAVIG